MFEQQVMLAVLRLGDTAYGMTIRREIAARAERNVALGAVYATLDRLEKKGYVKSAAGAKTPERQDRARRYFEVTALGEAALRRALAAVDALRRGLRLAPAGVAR